MDDDSEALTIEVTSKELELLIEGLDAIKSSEVAFDGLMGLVGASLADSEEEAEKAMEEAFDDDNPEKEVKEHRIDILKGKLQQSKNQILEEAV